MSCSPPPPPPPPVAYWYLQTTGLAGQGDFADYSFLSLPWHAPGYRCAAHQYPPDPYAELFDRADPEVGHGGSLMPALGPFTLKSECVEAWLEARYGAWWVVSYQPHDGEQNFTAPAVRRCVLTGSPTAAKGLDTWDVPDPTGAFPGQTVRRVVLDGPWFSGVTDCQMNLDSCCGGEGEPGSPVVAGYSAPGWYLTAGWETPTDTAAAYLSADPGFETHVYTVGYASEADCDAAGGMP